MASSSSSVGEVAQQVKVAPNTVRNWCIWHADHLSNSAKGRPRRFTETDLATFNLIADYRASGLKTATINERLVETKVQPGEIIAPDSPQSPPIQETQLESVQAPVLLLQAHTEALQRLTDRLENQRIQEVKALASEVARIRTWQLVQAAIVVVLIVAVVAGWVMV